MEVIVDGGELTMLHLVPPPTNAVPLTLTAHGIAAIAINRLTTHEMTSIWPCEHEPNAAARSQRPDLLLTDFESGDYVLHRLGK